MFFGVPVDDGLEIIIVRFFIAENAEVNFLSHGVNESQVATFESPCRSTLHWLVRLGLNVPLNRVSVSAG